MDYSNFNQGICLGINSQLTCLEWQQNFIVLSIAVVEAHIVNVLQSRGDASNEPNQEYYCGHVGASEPLRSILGGAQSHVVFNRCHLTGGREREAEN